MKKLIAFVIIAVMIIPVIAFSAQSSTYRLWRKKFLAITNNDLPDVIQAFQDIMAMRNVSIGGEPDLSSMSYDDLQALLANVRKEMLSKSQWTEVTVQPGHYVIGEDIPAGHWMIKYSPGEYSLIEYYLNVDSSGTQPADPVFDYNVAWAIGDPTSDLASVYDNQQIDMVLTDGYHINITYGSVVFTPFTGRQSPFFN